MNRPTAQKLLAELRRQQSDMVSMIAQLARIETPSAQRTPQTEFLDRFETDLRGIGYRCWRLKGTKSGGQLLATPIDRPRHRRRQILLGHCDTVWPLGTIQTMPVESREGPLHGRCLHGPGVYDMKAGLVQAFFALKTLQELQLLPEVTPLLFINSDEEIGSRESKHRIKQLAQHADRAFVMEPSLGKAGSLKTARKGVGRFIITISGKAAHAGLDPGKGVSAILELSHIVQALHALNDPKRGITVNVGTIDGGVRPNVVAPQSRAEIDVRVPTAKLAREIESAIHSIQPTVPGTELSITGQIGRPPLERTARNQELWARAGDAADALGIELTEAAAGGGSDGNYTSLYTATLDGLGAVGDGAHATHEHVIEDYLPERAALLACLLLNDPCSKTPRHAWHSVDDALASTNRC